MTAPLRVILELGKKRRIVAGAMDWPGLDRWGTSEEDALRKLVSYLPRYARVVDRAGLGGEFARTGDPTVVERVPGSSSTDFWGVAHVPSEVEREVLAPPALERRLALLEAAWAFFDHVAETVSPELRLGPRGGGRSREEIIRHVNLNEVGQFAGKVGVRLPPGIVLTPEGLAAYRLAYLQAILASNARGESAHRWPIQFLVRRTAHHVMDHAWEMEDRDLTT